MALIPRAILSSPTADQPCWSVWGTCLASFQSVHPCGCVWPLLCGSHHSDTLLFVHALLSPMNHTCTWVFFLQCGYKHSHCGFQQDFFKL